jgi:NAD(P)-dependent dehydrogenase (short-subunit alcohol dehydrogenase family)
LSRTPPDKGFASTYGIRVNAIAPGPIETLLVQAMHTAEARAAWRSAVPQRRYGLPAEIAGTAVSLLDEGKSGFVTGQTICIDGGFTIAGVASGTAAARGIAPLRIPP